MADIVTIKTFSDIYGYVLRHTKTPGLDQVPLLAVKGYINTALDEIYSNYKWPFLFESRDIGVIAKYTTGTISVTSGSRTITGTGTSWSDSFVGRKISISGNRETFEIISYESAGGVDTIQMSAAYNGSTESGVTYTIYQDEYGLFPDLLEIDTIKHDFSQDVVQPISPNKMTDLEAYRRNLGGKAIYYTVVEDKPYDGPSMGEMVMGYDFMGDEDSKTIRLYPGIPDAAYNLHIRYIRRPDPLVEDSDEPEMPIPNRIMVAYYAIAMMFSRDRNNETFAQFNILYNQQLQKMKAHFFKTDDVPRLTMTRNYDRRPAYYSPNQRTEEDIIK